MKGYLLVRILRQRVRYLDLDHRTERVAETIHEFGEPQVKHGIGLTARQV